MSTRCLIAKKTDTGFLAIYCHHDGYLSGVGKMLATHYTDPATVDALFALGNLSGLGASLHPHQTEAYSRDRGEALEDNAAETFPSLFYLRNGARKADAELLYVYDAGVWSYLDPRRDDLTLLEVPK
jgi:hypothetical protein